MELNLRKEEELLLLCARTHLEPETKDKIQSLVRENLDWDYLVYMAERHRLRPLLYWQLNQYTPETVPRRFIDGLKDFFDNNTFKNLFVIGKLFQILDLLGEVVAVPYKGPVLAADVYGNLAFREFNDLDIYIEKDDIRHVKKILTSSGYSPKLALSVSQENFYINSQREYKFFNEERSLGLEIQWNLVGVSFSFPEEAYYPVDNIISTEINNKKVNSFTSEDLVLILSIHAAGHLWERLSWICDIKELIIKNEDMDWDWIIEKAGYLQVERILYLNIYLVNYLFGLKIPEKVEERIKKDHSVTNIAEEVTSLIFNNSSSNIFKKIILRYRIREDKFRGLNDIWRILTIPSSDEFQELEKKGNSILSLITLRPKQIMNRLMNE